MLKSGMSTPIPAQSVETRSLHDLPINTISYHCLKKMNIVTNPFSNFSKTAFLFSIVLSPLNFSTWLAWKVGKSRLLACCWNHAAV